jgi:hypothetical protein
MVFIISHAHPSVMWKSTLGALVMGSTWVGFSLARKYYTCMESAVSETIIYNSSVLINTAKSLISQPIKPL